MRSCRELNSLCMKRLSRAKKLDYKGPKSLAAIITKIQEDVKKQHGVNVSYSFVSDTVRHFFGPAGIKKFMSRKKRIVLLGIGSFLVTPEERARMKKEAAAKLIHKRKVKARQQSIFRKRYGLRKKLRKINDYRATKGSEPISMEEFLIHVNKKWP